MKAATMFDWDLDLGEEDAVAPAGSSAGASSDSFELVEAGNPAADKQVRGRQWPLSPDPRPLVQDASLVRPNLNRLSGMHRS